MWNKTLKCSGKWRKNTIFKVTWYEDQVRRQKKQWWRNAFIKIRFEFAGGGYSEWKLLS